MNLAFTRNLENELDKIAEGQSRYLEVVKPAYEQLKIELQTVAAAGSAAPRYPCPKCGQGLQRKQRTDKSCYFWVCADFECKTFMDDAAGKPIPQQPPQQHPCPKCGANLRRYQKKDKTTQKPLGFGWFCTVQTCKTFLDDRAGKPIAQKKTATKH